jgi:hypothetical protein
LGDDPVLSNDGDVLLSREPSASCGRSFVEDILDKSAVERVGIPRLFVFVLVPGLPDDVTCFAAGLTSL